MTEANTAVAGAAVVKKLTVREALAAARVGAIVDVEVPFEPGLAPVRVRRIDAGQILRIAKEHPDEQGHARVLACVVDETGAAVFGSIEAVRATESELMQALLYAVSHVNAIEVETAAKN